MPWVTCACAAGVCLLPQRRPEETRSEALGRMWHGLVRDPFVYVALAFCFYLCLPLFNVGLSPLLNAKEIAAGANMRPPIPMAPFCVSVREHTGMLYWFVPTLLSALGVRHALTRAGKRAFYEILVWNGALLSVLGLVQIVGEAQFPFWQAVPGAKVHFFSVFGYPNMAGAFFGLNYTLALGLWVYRIGEMEAQPLLPIVNQPQVDHPILRTHYPFIAVALSLIGVLATLCRASISLVSLLSFLFLIYVVLRPFAYDGVQRARRFRSVVSVGVMMLMLGGVLFVYAPSDVGAQMRTVNVFSVSERVTGKAQYHTRAATAIMRKYPLFGVGGWGYHHFVPTVLNQKEVKKLQGSGGVNVHNDYLQFLAELGAVGFLFIVACVALLWRPLFLNWLNLVRRSIMAARSNMGSSSLAVFMVEAPVLWSFLGLIAVMIHAFGDCPFRSAAVLSLFFTIQAATMGFVPRSADVEI